MTETDTKERVDRKPASQAQVRIAIARALGESERGLTPRELMAAVVTRLDLDGLMLRDPIASDIALMVDQGLAQPWPQDARRYATTDRTATLLEGA